MPSCSLAVAIGRLRLITTFFCRILFLNRFSVVELTMSELLFSVSSGPSELAGS